MKPNINIFNIQDGGRPPSWKSLNCHISTKNHRFWWNLGGYLLLICMSATKQCLHLQSVAEINRHSVLSGDRIRQCGQLKNRNNLLMKLAGFTWGASTNTLRSSALALCYSVPSLVTLCSHKSGRCAVELYHASHLWYPPFYTSPMAFSALQHWTASPTKECCHWQADGENRQTWQLANPAW